MTNTHDLGRSLVLCLGLVAPSVLGACDGGKAPPASASPTSASTPTAATHVDGAHAKELVKSGARLVDVRSPDEYAEKHVDGAQNIPVDTIDKADLGPKDAPIVVYCHSGGRSARAAEALRKRGYSNVSDLGAMSNWDH